MVSFSGEVQPDVVEFESKLDDEKYIEKMKSTTSASIRAHLVALECLRTPRVSLAEVEEKALRNPLRLPVPPLLDDFILVLLLLLDVVEFDHV